MEAVQLTKFIATHIKEEIDIQAIALTLLKSTGIVYEDGILLAYNDTDVGFLVITDEVPKAVAMQFLTKYHDKMVGKLFRTADKDSPLLKFAEYLFDDVYRIKQWQ